ncbi:hypothetical protein GCM10009720_12790 [Yaniella flava]|uniref:Uncharacterized protein n=1 Tax=Yaniella flava TaxID=287930 RepID=A0ABP5FTC5_9MICC
MATLSPDMQELRYEALRRQARQRLDVFEDVRAAARAKARGLTQREIADLLVTSQASVHRLLKTAERRGDVRVRMPEESILDAFVNQAPRASLIDELKRFPYTFGEDAPSPHEGRLPGSWDQVVSAFMQDFLSEEEFTEVRAAIGR